MSLEGSLDVGVTDDRVEFAFAIRNGGDEPVFLEFPSGKVVDVAVEENGAEVWRWSDGRMFVQAIQTEIVPPGESAVYTITWDDPDPGEYTAKASLSAKNVTLGERASFEVP